MSTRYPFSSKTANAVWVKTNGHCFYCGEKLPPDTDFCDDNGKPVVTKRNWHIDHATPVSRGGTNQIENLFPACTPCNHRKSAMTSAEFIKVLQETNE